MPSQIVLFGATGYTGDLTARALVARGARPVLAARNADRVAALAAELGGLEHRVADVADPASVRALVGRGDVLVSTVGPFARWGEPAVKAAVDAGAHYLDSTGEGTFIRRVFEEWGPRAAAGGSALLTAFGFDWVPGNLAGALALERAGEAAARLQIGYFVTGSFGADTTSGGTKASALGALLDPSYTFRGGRVVTERGAARTRTFMVRPGKPGASVSVGGTEAFALPRLKPGLQEVDVYLGAFGRASGTMSRVGAATALGLKVPGMRSLAGSLAQRAVSGSTGGPDAATRAKTGSLILAEAHDAGGGLRAEVRLEGTNIYTFTAEILAWGAMTAAAGGLRAAGGLLPVDAFGLRELEAGAKGAGLAAA